MTELTATRLKIDPDRLTCWPIFSADLHAPQARPWQPGHMIRIGSLGRLHRNKGYDVLAGALAILKANGFSPPTPFEIFIAGEGIVVSAVGEMRYSIDNRCGALVPSGDADAPPRMALYAALSGHAGFAGRRCAAAGARSLQS